MLCGLAVGHPDPDCPAIGCASAAKPLKRRWCSSTDRPAAARTVFIVVEWSLHLPGGCIHDELRADGDPSARPLGPLARCQIACGGEPNG